MSREPNIFFLAGHLVPQYSKAKREMSAEIVPYA